MLEYSRKFISRGILLLGLLPVFLLGQSAFQMLDVPATALIMSLSGGRSSVSTTEPAENPATLSADRLWLQLNYALYPASIRLHNISAVSPLRTGVVGFSLLNINYGSLEDSETLNRFTASDILLRTSWKSTLLNSFSYGVSLNYFYSKLASAKASGLAVDLGLRTRLLKRRLGVGLSLENLGRSIDPYGSTREALPLAFRVALDYRPKHLPAILSMDAVNYRHDEIRYIATAELFTSDNVTLRLSTSSYKKNLENGSFNEKFISGMAGGFGIKFKLFTIDIGFQDLGSAGVVTAFSLKHGF